MDTLKTRGVRIALGFLTLVMVGVAGGLLWTTLVVSDSASGCAAPSAQENLPPDVTPPTGEELIGFQTALAAYQAEAALWTPEINVPEGGAAGGTAVPSYNEDGSPNVTGLERQDWLVPGGVVGGNAGLPLVSDPC